MAIEFADENEKNKKKETNSGTPVLDNFSKDLIKLAEQGKLDPVIGREQEILRIAQILSRRKKNNPIIIGEPGCGKTAIAEGLAMMIHKGECPKNLADKKIVSLDINSIVAVIVAVVDTIIAHYIHIIITYIIIRIYIIIISFISYIIIMMIICITFDCDMINFN